jgi:hypothetical protein
MTSVSNQVNAYGAPLYRNSVLGASNGQPIVKTNPMTGQFLQPVPTQQQQSGGGNTRVEDRSGMFWDAADGWKQINDSQEDTRMEQINRMIASRLDELRGNRNSALSMVDNILKAIDDKRKGFTEQKQLADDENYASYNNALNAMQGAARGSDAATTRRMLASGVSGSALDEALRRNEGQRSAQLGNVSAVQQKNLGANQAQFNERNNWADDQVASANWNKGEIERQYAQAQRAVGEEGLNTLQNLLINAQNNRAALAAALAGINNQNFQRYVNEGYGKDFTEGLSGLANPIVSAFGRPGNENTNFALEGKSQLDQDRLLRRRQAGLL